MITLEIPCKKYVKKYLIEKYGDSHQISKNTLLGLLTLELLEKNFDPKQRQIDFDTIYVVNIGEYYVNTKGVSVSTDKLNAIGASMERLFREDLFAYVDVVVRVTEYTVMEVIRDYLDYYKITECELKLSTIYKAYQRHQNFNILGHIKKSARNPYKQRAYRRTLS